MNPPPPSTEGAARPQRSEFGTFNRTLDWLWSYIEARTGVSRWPLRPQPAFSFKPAYWTGAFVALAFVIQAITGMLVLVYYTPSAAAVGTGGPPAAWASTQALIQNIPFGGLLLGLHLYGAYATIFLAFVHFFRGFYVGAYKPPREVSWFIGTALLGSMLGMGFTGYLLPYTSLSVGATNVGLTLVTSADPVGPLLAPFLQGDGTYQGLLSRMFALHVAIIPVILVALLWLHITLFETHGVAPPASSDPRARRTLTHEEDRRMGNWFPSIFLYGAKWGFAYLGALLLIVAAWPITLAPAFGSANQSGVSPEPDWYFLWLYKLADFQGVTPLLAMAVLGAIALGVLFLPWIEQVPGWIRPRLRNPRAHPRDRPIMVFLATYLMSFFVLLTVWGGVMPGTIIPPAMYVSYLGALAAIDAVVVFSLWYRYRRRSRARAERAARSWREALDRRPAPPAARPGWPFWNPRAAASVILVAGLLVPLGYILTIPSFTAVGSQQGVAAALAVICLALFLLVHLVERAVRGGPPRATRDTS